MLQGILSCKAGAALDEEEEFLLAHAHDLVPCLLLQHAIASIKVGDSPSVTSKFSCDGLADSTPNLLLC